MKFKKYLLVGSLFLFANIFAKASTYFEALDELRKPPIDATPIWPLEGDERKHFLELFKQSCIEGIDLHYDDNQPYSGDLSPLANEMSVPGSLYKGDFSNEGAVEYALIMNSLGSGAYNAVYFFKLVNGRLIPISYNGLNSGVFIATPFAVRKNNKTYIRFMEYPSKWQFDANGDYDRTKLKLCTYLWEGGKLAVAEPTLSFDVKGNLITIAEATCLQP